MGFNWNFKPRTINGFDSQPVDTLNPQVQPQPIQMAPVGLRGNETWRNQYDMPQTQRAAYMDEYEADQKWNEQPAELMQKADQGRISALENEIATLKQRIQENTAKLNNWTGNADQIAAIEARKINGADPTSIWRWKVDRDAAARLAAMEKEKNTNQALTNAQYEITNTLNTVRPTAGMDSAMKQSYLNKLADLKTMAQKNGLSTEEIDRKIKLVENDGIDPDVQTPPVVPSQPASEQNPYGTDFTGTNSEQVIAEVNQLLGKGNKATQKEFAELKNKYGTRLSEFIGNDLYNKLNAAHAKRIDTDKATADLTNMKNWLLSTFGIDYNKLEEEDRKSWREMWNAEKGKK